MDKKLCILFSKKQDVAEATENMIKEKHEESVKKAEDAMQKEIATIVVTNSSAGLNWEFKDYVNLADKYGYEIFVADQETKIVMPLEDCYDKMS